MKGKVKVNKEKYLSTQNDFLLWFQEIQPRFIQCRMDACKGNDLEIQENDTFGEEKNCCNTLSV